MASYGYFDVHRRLSVFFLISSAYVGTSMPETVEYSTSLGTTLFKGVRTCSFVGRQQQTQSALDNT